MSEAATSSTLDVLERGDVVEFRIAGESGVYSMTVDETLIEPPFPPKEKARELDVEPLPGKIQAALSTDGQQWCLTQELDVELGVPTGEIRASVKTPVDIRVPVEYEWRDVDVVEDLEVVT